MQATDKLSSSSKANKASRSFVHAALLEALKREIRKQWQTFVYLLFVTFIIMDLVAFFLWFSESENLADTIWGAQIFVLAFVTPFVISFLGASSGASYKFSKNISHWQNLLIGYSASATLCLLFEFGLYMISHWSDPWMDTFVQLYGVYPYLFTLLMVHVASFSIAFLWKRVGRAILTSCLLLVPGLIAFGLGIVLKDSQILSPLIWLRSAEVLDSAWIDILSLVMFCIGIAGCVKLVNKQNVSIKPFLFKQQVAILLPLLLYSVFCIALALLVLLRYQAIVHAIQNGRTIG